MIYTTLANQIIEFEKLYQTINKERQIALSKFSDFMKRKIKNSNEINLIFICTHNSRRSHMSQIWAQTASEYYKIPNVKCYSGGTETTAFNPRAIKAAKNSGFNIKQLGQSDNPVYHVYYSDDAPPIKCFSKVYNDEFNPQRNFAAVMTCSHADENCPIVFGAEDKFPIKYDDPKEFDDTELEEKKYSERFKQIGLEMCFTFYNIKNSL